MRSFVLSLVSVPLVAAAALAGAACGDDDAETASSGPGAGGGSSSSASGSGGDACTVEQTAEDQAPAPAIKTPRWALRPWISKDISDREDTYEFVDGFIERDIPVSVVVLDSPWEVNYNTFEPNPSRYPDFGGMVSDMNDRGVHVVLWTTQMLNQSSFDVEQGGDAYDGAAEGFLEALDCGYFVNGREVSYWWKGRGGGIDFFDPNASAFFHRFQDRVLDLGISGWKLDFGEQYIGTVPMTTDEGEKSLQEYSEAYYEDFYAYGAAKRGGPDDFVTMVRPYDRSYGFEGRFYARKEHAPIAWVGDNRRDDVGLADALDHLFRSARAGYAAIGSDLGGYLDRDDEDLAGETYPLDSHNFRRWTAMGVFTPFFQLHGRANIDPWTFPEDPEEVTAAYREHAKMHDALVPYFDALVRATYAGAEAPMRPIGEEADWAGDYRFFLGDSFLVAPALDAEATRDVALPSGRTYYSLWDLGAAGIEGGDTLEADTSDPARIPAYVMDGAIIPVLASADTPIFGEDLLVGQSAIWIVPGRDAALTAYTEDEDAFDVTLAGDTVTLSTVPETTFLRIRFEGDAPSVEGDAEEADSLAALEDADDVYFVDEEAGAVYVRFGASDGPRNITVAD
jgi:alpha-D-xyloside xylohydrolase